MRTSLALGLHAVIVAVTDEEPRILTVERRAAASDDELLAALPFGLLDPDGHRTLELGLRRWVRAQTGLELGYVEQLYTFGDRDREAPAEGDPGPRAGERLISVAYLALVREQSISRAGAGWRNVYRHLPWEDGRRGGGSPALRLEARLREWSECGPSAESRNERVDIAFGLGGAAWDGEKVLERYELLWEAGLVGEAGRDRGLEALEEPFRGLPMAADHRRILATALGRLRGKIKYRPVVFELLPSTFTLLRLQRVVEALAGVRLHKGNFRRLVDRGGLVEGTGRTDDRTGGRPAELFRFRREVLRERRAPGVGLPAMKAGG